MGLPLPARGPCGRIFHAPDWGSNSRHADAELFASGKRRNDRASRRTRHDLARNGIAMNQQTTTGTTASGSQVTAPQSAHVDADALAAELRGRSAAKFGSTKAAASLYATDGSNYRQVPIGVVIPRSIQDVIETVEIAPRATEHRFCSRGCGTSLAGQCCNVAVVMDFSKYLNRVLEIDADAKLGVVQPGCVLDLFAIRHRDHGLMYAPIPRRIATARWGECWATTRAARIPCWPPSSASACARPTTRIRSTS